MHRRSFARHSQPAFGRLRAANAAARLLLLLERGEQLRAAGYCLGLLRDEDLCWCGGQVHRRRARLRQRIRHRRAAAAHGRNGHDAACYAIGVPMTTVQELLRSWCGDDAAALLAECVAEGVSEIARGEWLHVGGAEVLRHTIGRRITLDTPAEARAAAVRESRYRAGSRNCPLRGVASPG